MILLKHNAIYPANVYGKVGFVKVNVIVFNNAIVVIMDVYGRIPNVTKRLAH